MEKNEISIFIILNIYILTFFMSNENKNNKIKNDTKLKKRMNDIIWSCWNIYYNQKNVFVKNQLESFNHMVRYTIPSIIKHYSPIIVDHRYKDITVRYEVSFSKIKIGQPNVQEVDDSTRTLFPQDARDRNLMYSAPIFVDLIHRIKIKQGNGEFTESIHNLVEQQIPLCNFPIMVHSEYCNLYGLPKSVIKNLGECQMDQGGYFIVKGSEKVIVPQERPAENIAYVRKISDKKKTNVTSDYSIEVHSSLNQAYYPIKRIRVLITKPKDKITKTSNFIDNGRKIYVNMIFFKKDMPLFAIYRMLGVETDYDIMKTIFPDIGELIRTKDIHSKRYQMLQLLIPSAHDIYDSNFSITTDESEENASSETKFLINSKLRAMQYLAMNSDGREYFKTSGASQEEHVMRFVKNLIENEFLPHLGRSIAAKVKYLTYMVRKLLGAVIGIIPVDDRDNYTGKRVENTGALLTQIFGRNYQKLVGVIENEIGIELSNYEKSIENDTQAKNIQPRYLKSIVQGNSIESKLKYALSTGNWHQNKNVLRNDKTGISQVLQRHSYLGMLSQLRHIQAPLTKQNEKIVPPRRLHGTQLGYLCVDETPEGKKVGVVKNLAQFAHITDGSDPHNIFITLRNMKIVTERHRRLFIFCVGDDGKIVENFMKEKPQTLIQHKIVRIFDEYKNEEKIEAVCFSVHINSMSESEIIELKNKFGENQSFMTNNFEHGSDKTFGASIIVNDTFGYINKYVAVETSNFTPEYESIVPIEYVNDNLNVTNIFVNGIMFGVINNEYAIYVYDYMKFLKLNGIIDIYTSISFNYDMNEIHIMTSAGRLVRPCFRVIDYEHINPRNPNLLAIMLKNRSKNGQLFNMMEDSWMSLLTDCIPFVDDPTFENILFDVRSSVVPYDSTRSMFDKEIVKLDYTGHEKDKIGVIEYIDVYESINSSIAFTYEDIINEYNKFKNGKQFIRYTHCDIHPCVMKGIVANTLVFGDKNPPHRNIYACAQSKQSVSKPLTNVRKHRLSTDPINESVIVQRPLVTTKGAKYIGLNELPTGAQSIVAIASYTGYNQEDSVIINKSAVDRGMFQSIFYRTYTDSQKSKTSTTIETFSRPDIMKGNTQKVVGKNYLAVDEDGFPIFGAKVNSSDVLIGKTVTLRRPYKNFTHEDVSTTVRHGENGQIDKIVPNKKDLSTHTNSDGNKIIKVRVANLRKTIIGDKFASRSAQKGTAGIILPQEDMPFSETGIIPDIIMNPHGILGRRTLGQVFEPVIAKACALNGFFSDATTFEKLDMSKIYEVLRQHGYDEHGDEYLYNGMTGRRMPVKIFIGPIYYNRLKHMVDDKVHARSKGPVTMMTHQPAEGRSRGGGLKIGEMERDALIAYGSTNWLKETFMDRSDKYRLFVSEKYGTNIIVNPEHNIYKYGSKLISKNDVKELQLPYAKKLLMQEFNAMGIKVLLETD